ncbi:MAG: tetratricopeptide repeat protein [Candidatus Polarisedimenticolia bacterium]
MLALAGNAAGDRVWGQAPLNSVATLDQAASLIQARAFERAAIVLRNLLSVDPDDRRAMELLAFALESAGDLDGEREVRSTLAAAFPGDARIQADYGRVLERSGDERGALTAYLHARSLSPDTPDRELDTAIDRMKGRRAVEVNTPVVVLADPDATASRLQAGAAVPFGSLHHLTALAARSDAEATGSTDATAADYLALSCVLRHRSGAWMSVGPSLHVISPQGEPRKDVGIGGEIAGRSRLGPWFEFHASGRIQTPWDEAAVTLLHGGRTTGAEGHVYAHVFDRRLLLMAGARQRRLSILDADPNSTDRLEASQSLLVVGADVVLWRKPGVAVRGEMLDEALVAPRALSSAVTLGYRHYAVSARSTPEFDALIALEPRNAVDEASATAAIASPRGRVGLELRGGLARDTEREARMWRAGGSLIWAPRASIRFELSYEEASDTVTGIVGQRHVGSFSCHVDF